MSPGEILAIMGPSGSGKSTLLHCLAGIFAPDRGEVWFDGQRLDTLGEAERTRLRRTAFGFVFQFGQLVPELTAADNVALPLLLNRVRRRVAYKTAETWLDRLGIGGQGRQPDRRAVRRRGAAGGGRPGARAGPEGDLRRRADRLAGLADRREGHGPADRAGPRGGHHGGLVTHDARVAAYADRVVMVRDGLVSGDLGEPSASRSQRRRRP